MFSVSSPIIFIGTTMLHRWIEHFKETYKAEYREVKWLRPKTPKLDVLARALDLPLVLCHKWLLCASFTTYKLELMMLPWKIHLKDNMKCKASLCYCTVLFTGIYNVKNSFLYPAGKWKINMLALSFSITFVDVTFNWVNTLSFDLFKSFIKHVTNVIETICILRLSHKRDN